MPTCGICGKELKTDQALGVHLKFCGEKALPRKGQVWFDTQCPRCNTAMKVYAPANPSSTWNFCSRCKILVNALGAASDLGVTGSPDYMKPRDPGRTFHNRSTGEVWRFDSVTGARELLLTP